MAQDMVKVDIYRRAGEDWELECVSYAEQINLRSVGFAAEVETFYEDVLGNLK